MAEATSAAAPADEADEAYNDLINNPPYRLVSTAHLRTQYTPEAWAELRGQQRNLESGAVVLLSFLGNAGQGGERMWVEYTTQTEDGRYMGILASDPQMVTELAIEDTIVFAPEDIWGVWQG